MTAQDIPPGPYTPQEFARYFPPVNEARNPANDDAEFAAACAERDEAIAVAEPLKEAHRQALARWHRAERKGAPERHALLAERDAANERVEAAWQRVVRANDRVHRAGVAAQARQG